MELFIDVLGCLGSTQHEEGIVSNTCFECCHLQESDIFNVVVLEVNLTRVFIGEWVQVGLLQSVADYGAVGVVGHEESVKRVLSIHAIFRVGDVVELENFIFDKRECFVAAHNDLGLNGLEVKASSLSCGLDVEPVVLDHNKAIGRGDSCVDGNRLAIVVGKVEHSIDIARDQHWVFESVKDFVGFNGASGMLRSEVGLHLLLVDDCLKFRVLVLDSLQDVVLFNRNWHRVRSAAYNVVEGLGCLLVGDGGSLQD